MSEQSDHLPPVIISISRSVEHHLLLFSGHAAIDSRSSGTAMVAKWFLALSKVAHKVLVGESARFHLGGGGRKLQ